MDKKVPMWIMAISVLGLCLVAATTNILNYRHQQSYQAAQTQAHKDCATEQGDAYNTCMRNKGFSSNW